jgi:protein O-mannosyl-transferase
MRNMRKSLIIFLIVVLGVIAYGNTLFNGFVYDDPLVVEGNPFITSFSNLIHLFNSNYYLGSGETSWRPVATVSYFIDYQLWQFNPFGYHLTNLVLHILNALLFYYLLLNLIPILGKGILGKTRSFLNYFYLAFLSALIFVLHPLTGEAVNAVGFRHELLLTFFFLLSLLLYFKNRFTTNKRQVIIFYGFSLIFYMLAMLSKEMAVVLPFFIILFEFYFSKKEKTKFFKKNNIILFIGYLIILALYIWIRFFIFVFPEETIGGLLNEKLLLGGNIYSWFLTIVVIFASYIKLLLFPLHLSPEHMVQVQDSLFNLKVILSFCSLFFILFLVIKNFRKRPLITFSLFWIFVPLVTVSNIIPLHHPMAERYLYLSCLGFSLFFAYVLLSLFRLKFLLTKKTIVFSGIFFLLSFYLIRTITYNRIWRNKGTFWKSVVLDNLPPHRARSYSALGLVYYREGNYQKAENYFKKSLKEGPYYAKAYNNLGLLYCQKEDWDKGIEYFNKALLLDPNLIKAHSNLGLAYVEKKKLDKAIKSYKQIIEVNPYLAESYSNLGQAYLIKKEYQKAISYFKKALNLNPHLAEVYSNLGKAYWFKGDVYEAVDYYKKALELNPCLDKTHANLGQAYLSLNQIEKSLKHYKEAIKSNPKKHNYYFDLGLVYLRIGKNEQAVSQFEKVLEIVPDFGPAYYNIAISYYRIGQYNLAIEFCNKAVDSGYRQAEELLKALKNIINK